MKIDTISELKIKLQEQAVTEHKYENVELKKNWDKSHGAKISMLCNGQPNIDCFLVIGVDDKGKLAGHHETWLIKNLEVVSQHCNQYLDPVISLQDITTEDINGSKVIICVVKNPGVVVKWSTRAYGGNGTTKTELSPEEILELNLALPGLTDLSKAKANYTPTKTLVRKFCEAISTDYKENILDRFHLAKTKCGELLFGDTKYRFVTYNAQGDVIKNETRLGLFSLLSHEVYDEIRHFYSEHIPDCSVITNSMLREAIGNSVGHAAYKDNCGEIIIELRPDRIAISNLAYVEYTSLANKWFSSAHKSPNSFLMETLRIAGKVDELGRGKTKLLSECLTNGLNAPSVTISDAGRYKRWTLQITFQESVERYYNLRASLLSLYNENQEKSLISYALVLWREKPFSEISRYFDTYESKIATEIISRYDGPVFYWEEKDKITLHRWVKILLEEGKASKEFTHHEEQELYKHCFEMHTKYHGGLITPIEFRQLAHLSNSGSDKSLTSRMLTKWKKEGKLSKVKRGTYKFIKKNNVIDTHTAAEEIWKIFSQHSE